MSTTANATGRAPAKAPRRRTAQMSMGRSQLESDSQRTNFHRDLISLCETGRAQEMIQRVYSKRWEEAVHPLLEKNAERRREYQRIAVEMQAGTYRPKSDDEWNRYNSLVSRYGVPSASDVHIDTLATDVLIDFPQAEFIAPFALPFKSVAKRSGKMQPLSRRAGKNASYDDTRAPGTPAKSLSYDMGTPVSYSCQGRGFDVPIPDEVIQDEDDPIRVAELTARYVQECIMLKHEKRVATLLQTTTTYPAAHRMTAPSVKWNASDRSDPEHLDDVHTLQNLIRQAIGKLPNTAILNFPTLQALIRKTDFADRVKYVERIMDSTLMDLAGAYLSVQNVLVGMAMEDTANIAATESWSDVWTDSVVLAFIEEPGIGSTTLGCAPVADPGTVLTYRDPNPTAKSDHAAYLLDVDEIVLQDVAGGIIPDVLS